MKLALLFALPLAVPLAGCVAYSVDEGDGLKRVGLGQTARFSGFELTPLAVLEDSRCPTGVQCVWEGRVRLRARIDFDDSVVTRELVLGEAQPVGSGMLTLADVRPHPEEGATIYPEDYRFGFSYAPHLMD